jgi:hypothetical protein
VKILGRLNKKALTQVQEIKALKRKRFNATFNALGLTKVTLPTLGSGNEKRMWATDL